jgi:hypothetical protein
LFQLLADESDDPIPKGPEISSRRVGAGEGRDRSLLEGLDRQMDQRWSRVARHSNGRRSANVPFERRELQR